MTYVPASDLEFNVAIPACDLTEQLTRAIETHGLTVTKIDTKYEMQAGIREPMFFITFTLTAGDEQVKVDSVFLDGDYCAAMEIIEHTRNTNFHVDVYLADEYAMPIDIIYMGAPISFSE